MAPPPSSPLSFRKKLFYAGFAGFSLLVITFTFYFYQQFYSANIRVGKDDVRFFIAPETSFDRLMTSFRQGEIFSDELSFRFVAKVMEFDTPKPGWYAFKEGMTNVEAIRMLRIGEQLPLRVTFNNVRLKPDLAGRLTRHIQADSLALLKLLNDPKVAQEYGFSLETFPCMFLPNTYEMFWNTDEEALLKRMKREYARFWTEERKQKADSVGLSPVEVGILASIVDAEASRADEKPRIAGLYLNRLKRGQRLEADPTVVFAVGDFSLKRVLFKHLEVESPYNTYKNAGLPPGPIRVPSLTGVKAVLNAEKHKYIFMCAREDFSGYHSFAETAAQHNRNAARYRRALNQRGIR